MNLFACDHCGLRVYFENTQCTACGSRLGFLPDRMRLASLQADGDGVWRSADGQGYRACENCHDPAVCNWMLPAEDPEAFCIACRLNHTIPDLSLPGHVDLWRDIESAKRRLVYSLLRLGLPFGPSSPDIPGLAFDFLADTPPTFQDSGRVLTGHKNGLITLNIAEADPVLREKMRAEMDETYRTLLGHFRHESGHYFWDRLVRNDTCLEDFRALFGDERDDYGQALARYRQFGSSDPWTQNHISAYASSHPWEDWAETWAHYLHMVDTLETAANFGISIRPRTGHLPPTQAPDGFDPYTHASFDDLVGYWMPLTHAMNSLNRSMGHKDAYPFAPAPRVIEKLNFIHRRIRAAGEFAFEQLGG